MEATPLVHYEPSHAGRDAVDRHASLQVLFGQANLILVTPSPPALDTFSAFVS